MLSHVLSNVHLHNNSNCKYIYKLQPLTFFSVVSRVGSLLLPRVMAPITSVYEIISKATPFLHNDLKVNSRMSVSSKIIMQYVN